MRIHLSFVICVVLSGVLCSNGITQETGSGEVYEWPMIAGDAGWTGFSPDPRVKPPFRLKWVSQPGSMGGTGNNIIVAGGRVFSRACCVDADTGDVLWKRSVGGTPTYYKGRLYTCKGGVTAIDAATGKRLWSKRGYRGPGGHWSAVTVTDGAVYVGSIKEHNGKQTYFANALDAADGRELWSVPLIETVKLPRKSGYTPGVKMGAMAVKGGLVVATTHSPPAVFGLDQKTGKELWRQENVKAWIAPTNDGNMVLAPQAMQGVWAMEAGTGKKLWHWGTEWTDGPRGASAETRANYAGLGTAKYPIISAYGMLFASNYGRRYTALDAKTGKKLWEAGDRKDVHSAWAGSCGPPTAAGGYVYTRGTVGKEYNGKRFRFVAAAVDKETGRPVWVRPVSGKSCARPVIAYGRIYVPTASDIYCFEPVPPDYKYEPQAVPEKPAAPLEPMAKPFGGKPGEPAAGEKPKGGVDWPMYGGCPARCGLEFKIGLPIKEAWKFQTGGKVKSSPVIADALVYAGSDSGKLFALDLKTGKEKWSAEITPPEESKINVKWIRSTPAVAEGIVVCGADDGVMRAFDAQTGDKKWQFRTAAQIRSSAAIVGEPKGSSGVERRVVFGSWDGHCYCLRLSDGVEFWRFRVGDPGVRVHVPLAVAAGRVYAGAIEDYAIPGLDLGTGRTLTGYHDGTPPRGKKSPALGIVQGVAVYRGCLITIGKGAVLDAVTGKQLGAVRSPGTGLPSLPAFSGETVYTSLSVQGTGIPDIMSKTRSRKRPQLFRNTVINTPLVCGNIMIVATARGTVEAYQLTDGKSSKPVWEWKSQSGKEISTAPAAGSGFIVVGSDDGHIYGFNYVRTK